MVGALWTGISGLAGQQVALDNESNNIANVNTIGYKASRISFADQMYQNKIGKGTTIQDAEKLYTQGNLKMTGVAYDVALSGDGFFAVSNTRGAGTAETFYTRAGNFRMGDNGTLQDAAGNEVQGWAMSELTDDDIVSTDPNIKSFTDDFVKLGASEIIHNTNTIETITAKMTDYTESAQADAIDVFSGANYKSKAAKVADIEKLISKYDSALINYKNNPDTTSVTPGNYKNTLDYSNGISDLNGDGDTISVYIDSAKYTQTWDTDLSTTLKKFTNQLSNITGVNAWITDTADTTTINPTDTNGFIRIESSIPGENLTISQLAISTSTGASTPGTLKDNSIKVEQGGGYAAVTAARDALKKATTGKQHDVWTSTDLDTPDGAKDYSYQITIYDKQGNQNISVPTTPLAISDPKNVQDIVESINGNTVLGWDHTTTADANNADKWTTTNALPDPLATDYWVTVGSHRVLVPSGTANANIADVINADGYFGTDGVITASMDSGKLVLEYNTNDVAFTPTLASKKATEDVAGELPYYVKASNVNGNLVVKTLDSNYDLEFSSRMKRTDTATPTDLVRNTVYSGRDGANAEFLEITNTIQQTGSRGGLQLKLDSLGISNSPFGDFSVDNTGVITMKQDGATFAVGQIAVALFNDNRGLEPMGDNLLASTERSGAPIYNLNNNKTADIKSNTLELSTADLSVSLVNPNKSII
jgi:flagellar hook protein FlgE